MRAKIKVSGMLYVRIAQRLSIGTNARGSGPV
jgi:hypothetical protein